MTWPTMAQAQVRQGDDVCTSRRGGGAELGRADSRILSKFIGKNNAFEPAGSRPGNRGVRQAPW